MLKLEVGKFYMSANGEVVEIVRKKENTLYSNFNVGYLENGRYLEEIKTKLDLIAEIPKELHQHLIKQVMDYWQDEDFRNTVNNVYGGEK